MTQKDILDRVCSRCNQYTMKHKSVRDRVTQCWHTPQTCDKVKEFLAKLKETT